MAEGKVASLFVEFRATVDKFATDIRQMLTDVRTFDTAVKSAQKSVSDLGHLGSVSTNQYVGSLERAISGMSTLNTYTQQAATGVSNLGHLGAAAAAQANVGMQAYLSGLSTANTYAQQAGTGVSNLGHLGATAAAQANTGLQAYLSGLSTANTYAQQAATGVSNLGHLGGTAFNQATVAAVSFSTQIKQMSADVRSFDRIFYPISQRIQSIGTALSVGITAPLGIASALVLKTGVDFESAFAGVRKTVQASEEELANLRGELIKMSTEAPVSAVEFAKIAQAAGELGIKTTDIARFSQTVAELTATTRLTSDEASNFLGRFANITQLDPGKIHNLASTVVALGHGFAASEKDIAAFALRIARVGSFVGLSQADILAFSAALASVGVTAEAGGTAISRVFAEIDKAVLGNTKRLAEYASVAGKLPGEFANLFKTDPSAAVTAFVDGLKRIRDEGGNVFATLDTLKLSNVRVRDTLFALSQGVGQLTDALGISRKEIEADAELTRAYGERSKTTEAQLAILRHEVEALGISLFEAFGPTIKFAIASMREFVDQSVKPAVEWFTKLSPASQHFIEAMLLVAAAVGPAILAINQLIWFLGGLFIIYDELVTKFAGTAVFTRFGSVISGLALPLTIVSGILAGWELENIIIDALGLTKQFDELKSSVADLGGAVLKLANDFAQLTLKRILDDFEQFTKVGKPVIDFVKDMVFAFTLLKIFEATRDIKAATAALNELSGTVTMSTKPLTDSNSAIQAWSYNLPIMVPNVMKLTGAVKELNHVLTPEEIEDAAEAAKKLAKAHEALLQKFNESLRPADMLNEELSYLQKYFSDDQLVAVYGKRIVDATEAQRAHGIAVSGATLQYYDQAKAVEVATEKLKDLIKEIRSVPVEAIGASIGTNLPGISAGPPTSELGLKRLTDFGDAKEQINELGRAINDLNFLPINVQLALFDGDLEKAKESAKKFHFELSPVIIKLLNMKEATKDAEEATKAWDDAVNKGTKTVDEMAMQIATTVQNVKNMDEAGFVSAQIWEILGAEIDKAAENARILGVTLDPVVAMLAKMREELKNNAKEATDFEKEISRLTAKIVNDLANGIADAILSSGDIGEVAIKIAKDFAAAFIKAVVSELIRPLVEAFAELGRTIAKNLIRALGDAAPAVAAIVLGVIAAIGLIKSLGNSHVFASKFVKETQDPFGKSLVEFTNAANKLYEAGRQTYQGAQEAEAKVREMWKGFLDDAAKFGEEGRKQATVAAQAIATLEPVIKGVIFNIRQQIEQLKPPSVIVIDYGEALAGYRAAIASLTEERVAALTEELNATRDYITYVEGQIRVTEEVGDSTKDLNGILADAVNHFNDIYNALNPIIPEMYSFAEAVKTVSETLVPDKTDEFINSVINATAGAANLEKALSILEEVKTPVGIILDRLGNDITDFVDALTLSGLPIPELIAKYFALGEAQKALKESASKASGEMPRIANSLSKIVGEAVNSLREIAGGGDLSKGILDALTRLLTNLPPASVAVPKPATTQVTISIVDNEQITNMITFTADISRVEVRDKVIPEITEVLTNNTDSTQEKWTKLLKKSWDGVVTE